MQALVTGKLVNVCCYSAIGKTIKTQYQAVAPAKPEYLADGFKFQYLNNDSTLPINDFDRWQLYLSVRNNF